MTIPLIVWESVGVILINGALIALAINLWLLEVFVQ